jgi:hypothetical protein
MEFSVRLPSSYVHSLLADPIAPRPPPRRCPNHIRAAPRLEHPAGLVAFPRCPSRDIRCGSYQRGILSTRVCAECGQKWWEGAARDAITAHEFVL